jgi:hypothetical protein
LLRVPLAFFVPKQMRRLKTLAESLAEKEHEHCKRRPGAADGAPAHGDWWEYAVEGSVAREGRTSALRGEVRVTIERARSRRTAARLDRLRAGPPHRRHRWRRGAFSMPTGVFYIEQDAATNAVRIAGDNMGPGGSDRFAKEPQVFYPGTFDAGTAYDNVLDFGPHGRVANTLRTVGVETVETALGRFAAWKAPIRSTSEQFGTVEGCDWWRPALGAPLRFEMVATGPDGSLLRTTAVLRAASRALR